MSAHSLATAARAVREARHLLIGAGAGIGVDSGLPDFRGDEGFWNAYPPYRDKGLSFISMASPRWFALKPDVGWGFYGHRLALYRATEPHEGFEILLRWARDRASHFVFTSNVDGQFHKAGFDPARIYEVHGSIHHLQCSVPCCDDVYPADEVHVEVDPDTMLARPPLPTCPRCGQLARPNVLMFGDFAYTSSREHHPRGAYDSWSAEVRGEPAVVIELGAGSAVPTVRMECERAASAPCATLIRINPREPEVPRGQIGLPMGARNALRAIDALL